MKNVFITDVDEIRDNRDLRDLSANQTLTRDKIEELKKSGKQEVC